MNDRVLDKLARARRMMTARDLSRALGADLADVHAALLELHAEGKVDSFIDTHAVTAERWSYHGPPLENEMTLRMQARFRR